MTTNRWTSRWLFAAGSNGSRVQDPGQEGREARGQVKALRRLATNAKRDRPAPPRADASHSPQVRSGIWCLSEARAGASRCGCRARWAQLDCNSRSMVAGLRPRSCLRCSGGRRQPCRSRAGRSIGKAARSPPLGGSVRRNVPRPDSRGVLPTRGLGHEVSFRLSPSVTPVVRHQPCVR